MLQIIPIKSVKIIEKDDDLLDVFFKSLNDKNLELQDDDVLVITSKVISVVENQTLNFSEIKVSEKAKKLSEITKLPSEFVQVVLNESNEKYIGAVPGVLTTINKYGILANAGADMSNTRDKTVIRFPRNPKKSAEIIHKTILEKTKKYVGIIIADSRTSPLRRGTIGSSIATYGFLSIIDERGKTDLFGREMKITTRAIADQLTSASELVMGETNEQTPFTIIRNYPITRIKSNEEKDINNLISAEECMFIGPFLKNDKK